MGELRTPEAQDRMRQARELMEIIQFHRKKILIQYFATTGLTF
jgi:hypothetical protein